MQLERFKEAKAAEIATLRKALDAGELVPPEAGQRVDFLAALTLDKQALPHVIAEYKRASPSRGIICQSLSVEEVAVQYADAGASALSILTEERFFDGQITYLERARDALRKHGVQLPLLRKDFLFDPVQVYATAQTAASALLLIVRLLPDVRALRKLRELAESFGLSAVVEVFDAQDLALARESGAKILQVNARDLDTLTVDRQACLRLAEANPPENAERWICASGISEPEHLQACAEVGFCACLVGTSLMRDGQPGQALSTLLGGYHRAD